MALPHRAWRGEQEVFDESMCPRIRRYSVIHTTRIHHKTVRILHQQQTCKYSFTIDTLKITDEFVPRSSNHANGTSHSWASLPNAMSKSVSSLQKTLDKDPQWQAFIDTNAIIEPVTFGIKSTDSDDTILVHVTSGAKTSVSTGPSSKADFVLGAGPDQWERFFDKDPVAPYTSFVGLQG